jgi:hypothetical protein
MRCKDCTCLDKRNNTCKVFTELLDNCSVYTTDPNYIRKIDNLSKHYTGYRKICQYKEEQKRARTKRAKEKPATSIPKGDANC